MSASHTPRLAFERDRPYSLAGLNPAQAEEYDHVRRLINRLSYAVNEAARRYLDGHIASDQAAAWLETHGLTPAEHARRRVRSIDDYRSYVINYNLGHDVVRAHVEVNGGTADGRIGDGRCSRSSCSSLGCRARSTAID